MRFRNAGRTNKNVVGECEEKRLWWPRSAQNPSIQGGPQITARLREVDRCRLVRPFFVHAMNGRGRRLR